MKKTGKTLLFSILFMCTFCTQAFASLFYELTGYTNVYELPVGVALYAESSTDGEDVDYIEVISYVYINGTKYSTVINYKNDFNYTFVYKEYPFSGFYYINTKHYVQDWTGNEEEYTTDSFQHN